MSNHSLGGDEATPQDEPESGLGTAASEDFGQNKEKSLQKRRHEGIDTTPGATAVSPHGAVYRGLSLSKHPAKNAAEGTEGDLRVALEKRRNGGTDATPGATAVSPGAMAVSSDAEAGGGGVYRGLRLSKHQAKSGGPKAKGMVDHSPNILNSEGTSTVTDRAQLEQDKTRADIAARYAVETPDRAELEQEKTRTSIAARYACNTSNASLQHADHNENDTANDSRVGGGEHAVSTAANTVIASSHQGGRAEPNPGAVAAGGWGPVPDVEESGGVGGDMETELEQPQQQQEETGDILLEATLVDDSANQQAPQPPPPPNDEEQQDNPIHIPEAEMLQPKSLAAKWSGTSTKGKLTCLVIALVVLGLALTGVVCGATDVCAASNDVMLSDAPTVAPTPFFLDLPSYSMEQIMNDPLSVQSKAYGWLMERYGYENLLDMSTGRRGQLFALVCIYYSFDGTTDPDFFRSSVVPLDEFGVDECEWGNEHISIECDRGTVYAFRIQDSDLELQGKIPSEIELLSGLQTFSLSQIKLIGKLEEIIPAEFSELQNLTYLDLYDNGFTGQIPSAIFKLPKLAYINMHRNGLNGTIPSEIGLLSSLETLEAGSNNMQGTIPTEIGIPNFTSLKIYRNYNLGGTVPSQIGRFTLLKSLELNQMLLSGTIPTEVGLLTALTSLDFSYCDLTGSIPSQLGLLSNLREIKLEVNDGLSGTVPDSVCTLSTRRKFTLQVNDCPGNSGADTSFLDPNAPSNYNVDAGENGGSTLTGNDLVNANGLVFCPETCRCKCG